MENFNYLIKEHQETSARELIAKITVFFAKSYCQRIIIITKDKVTAVEAEKLFSKLTNDERQFITFMYCDTYQAVLNHLLVIDTHVKIPKVLIIESLHQWYNSTTPMEKIPSIYTTIMATAQDLVNVSSKLLNQPCFSFITSKPDEMPTNIVEVFYDFPIEAGEDCLVEVFEKHKKPE